MKIVYAGVNPEDKPFHLECRECKTIVEIFKRELSQQKADGPQLVGSEYVVCPTCKKWIFDTAAVRASAEEKLKTVAAKKEETQPQQHHDLRDDPPYARGGVSYDPYEYPWTAPYGGRSGGPTGPLPPPELHCIKVVKVLSEAK